MTSHYQLIRHLRVDDLDSIARIEQRSFAEFSTRESLREMLFSRQPVAFGLGAFDYEHQLQGFLMYLASPGERRIINLAVDPPHRRRRVASNLIGFLQQIIVARNFKLHRIIEVAHERNEVAVKLFAKCGFAATGLERDAFDDGDGIIFEWSPSRSECGDEIDAERFGDDGELVTA